MSKLLILSGNDEYEKERYTKNLFRGEKRNIRIFHFEKENFSWKAVEREIFTQELFEEKKIFIIREVFSEFEKNPKRLKNILSQKKREHCFFLAATKNSPKASFLSAIEGYYTIKTFQLPRYFRPDSFINVCVSEKKTKIDREVIKILCDNFINKFITTHDIEKLSIAGSIDRAMKEKLITRSVDADVFTVIDAATSQNIVDTRLLLEKFQPNFSKAKENLIKLLSMLNSQFLLLYQIKILREKNFPDKKIREKLSLHPYRYRKLKEKLTLSRKEDIQKILEKLFQLEEDIKTKSLSLKPSHLAYTLIDKK